MREKVYLTKLRLLRVNACRVFFRLLIRLICLDRASNSEVEPCLALEAMTVTTDANRELRCTQRTPRERLGEQIRVDHSVRRLYIDT